MAIVKSPSLGPLGARIGTKLKLELELRGLEFGW